MKRKVFVCLALAALVVILAAMPVYAREGNRNCGWAQTCCGIDFAVELAERYFNPDALLEERAAYLDGLVAGGYLTQVRANDMLECFRAMIEYRTETGIWQCQRLGGVQCLRAGEGRCQRVGGYMNNGGSRQRGCRRRNGS